MSSVLRYLLVVPVIVLLSLSSFAQTSVNGAVAGTWTKANSPYVITGSITIPASQTLTIEAGVVIESPRFGRDINVYGTLLAQGTVSDSIRFRGKADLTYDARSTHGGGLYFYNGGTGSILQYVSVDQMGDASSGGKAMQIDLGQTPTIKNTIITHSEQDDVVSWVGGAKNFASTKAIVSINASAGNLDASMPKLGYSSFYRLANTITVSQNYKLVLEPGVVIESPRFGRDINVYGTLLAQGTVSDSIRFRGKADLAYDPQSTHGGGLYFYNGGTGSILQYVSIDQMGDASSGGKAMQIDLGQTPTIRNTTITHSEQDDVVSWVGGAKNFASTKAIVSINVSAGNLDASMPKLGYSSFYRLANTITVSQNYKLVLEPGVVIESPRFGRDINVYGTLLAQGTVSDSIRFRGKADLAYDPQSTHGGGLYFYNGGTGSILQYVSIDQMGDASSGGKAMQIDLGQTPTIRNTTITHSEQDDVVSWVGGAKNFASTKAIVSINVSAGNLDASMPKLGYSSFYRLANTITVSQNYKLVLEPGVVIESPRFGRDINVYGTLLAQGTVSDSIRFRGKADLAYDPQSTHGGGLYFYNGGTGSILQYVSIDQMGDASSGGKAMQIETICTIKNSILQNSEQNGIVINSSSISPIIQDNKFLNNLIAISAYPGTCSGIRNNVNAKILLQGGNVAANVSWPFPGTNSYYVLTNQVQVQETYTLTIEAGSLVDFGLQAGELYVSGTLRAVGTESAPIQFARLQTPSSPVYNGRVYLHTTSISSILTYVRMDKLGTNDNYAALEVATPNFSISNISISNALNVGLKCTSVTNPIITGSNFFNNKTGVLVISGKPVFSKCNIYANTDFGINNVSNAVADTVDARNSYWGTTSGPYHPSLNSSGTGNKVSNKVKFQPYNQQPQKGQISDIGISAILSPITDCNHTASDSIKVEIRNFGNVSQTNFPISYRINNGPVVNEIVTSFDLLPGVAVVYTFNQRANLSAFTSYSISASTGLVTDTIRTNDTAQTVINHLSGIAAPTNLMPFANALDVDVTVPFTWAAVTGTTGYDLYVWKATDAIPTRPLVENITQISYTLPNNGLQYGTQYKWKVVSRQISCRTESPVLTFTTRQLPDLVVESINVPPVATSETDLVVNWKITNQGAGGTQNQGWTDLVYLCDQPVLNAGSENYYLNNVPNFSALNAGQSYQSNNVTYRVPQGVLGRYYIIVRTNPSASLQEASGTNNERVSQPINIALAPPPDLQVTNVIVNPLNVFSEDSIAVSYTIKNLGTGPTTVTSWTDHILLSQSETVNVNTDSYLLGPYHIQALSVNGEYTINTKVKLPCCIGGTYYIHIVTDRFNQVYEYNKEDNNSRNSLAINVIQRPTPNLTVSPIMVSTTAAANNQSINLQWTTTNEGSLTASPTWLERIYLSVDPVYNEGTDQQISTSVRTESLPSLVSNINQQVVTLPSNLIEGNYYLFVKTDAGNSIYENPAENDNVSTASAVVHVDNPDLVPTALIVPATAMSEQSIDLQWRVKNDSPGGVYNFNWADQIYLSTNNTFEAGYDILLTNVAINQLVAPGAEYSKQIIANLPVGISGNYYLLIVSDANGTIYEKRENNNIQATPITVTLAPWPDLQITNIIAPAVDTVNTTINIQYTTKNNGIGNIVNKTWSDVIYLSPSNAINETSLIYLGGINQSRSLSNGQSFMQSASFTIPTNLASGNYYTVIKTDANNTVFENTGEGNNLIISSVPTTISSLPSIDLSVIAGAILSTSITAGSSVDLQWTVKNNSGSRTLASYWQDALYLSTNPILDASDVLLSSVYINTPMPAGATYTKTQTVTIPSDASGTLYILVNTDKDNQNNDDKRENNTLPLNSGSSQGITVTIPLPADLAPKSLLCPAQGTLSQPVNFTFTVTNNGTGPTSSGYWNDQLYLSTDPQLQLGNDIILGTFTHIGALATGADYTVTGQVFLPSNVLGNYVVLLKTDAFDNVYERGHETNNLATSNIFITAQQPSDLTITQIGLPTNEQSAGDSTTINWNLKNIGGNAANGFLREAVYLSKDATLDASDVLFGTLDGSLFLPSQATQSRTIKKPLANVTIGEYYVIVKADILNNIVESNESNNQTVSVGKIVVTVRELPLNTLIATELVQDVSLYYRLVIPPGLTNETLSIVLKGDSAKNAVNRLFIRKDSIPTVNRYDYAATVSFKANQELLIPSLQAGTYYLMSLGSDPEKGKQPVSLLAKVIPFSIALVDASKGGNTGLVTIKITGARFEPGMTVTLLGATTYTATNVYFSDPSKLFATFNLSGATLGQYTVRITKQGGATTQLSNSFQVVAGTPGGVDGALQLFTCAIQNIGFDENIDVDIVHPATVRRNSVFKMSIAYSNEGNVDIPAQSRVLLSLSGAPLNYIPEFSKNLMELVLEFIEKEGPPDVLRAGSSGFVNIYSKASVSRPGQILYTITQ